MTTREEQFEIDRKKMMAQMGADEEAVETESVPKSSLNDFPDVIMTPEAEAILDRFDRDIDEIMDDPAAFEEREKAREKDVKESKKAFESEGRVKLCPMVAFFGNYNDSGGGGIGMWLITIFAIFPLSIKVFLEGNLVSAAVVFAFAWVMARMLSYLLSFAVSEFIVKEELKNGPKFLIDTKEPSAFNVMTPLMNIVANQKIIVIGIITIFTMFLMGLFFYGEAFSCFHREGMKGFLIAATISLSVACMLWVIAYGVGWIIYSSIAEGLIKSGSGIQYRLRYLFSPSRVMISMRKSNNQFVSLQERMDAMRRDYSGVVS